MYRTNCYSPLPASPAAHTHSAAKEGSSQYKPSTQQSEEIYNNSAILTEQPQIISCINFILSAFDLLLPYLIPKEKAYCHPVDCSGRVRHLRCMTRVQMKACMSSFIEHAFETEAMFLKQMRCCNCLRRV